MLSLAYRSALFAGVVASTWRRLAELAERPSDASYLNYRVYSFRWLFENFAAPISALSCFILFAAAMWRLDVTSALAELVGAAFFVRCTYFARDCW